MQELVLHLLRMGYELLLAWLRWAVWIGWDGREQLLTRTDPQNDNPVSATRKVRAIVRSVEPRMG